MWCAGSYCHLCHSKEAYLLCIQFRSDLCLTQSEGLNRYGPGESFLAACRGGSGHKSTGYESGGPQDGPRSARSSGTARKSCCHRRDTCGLQRVGEGSIQAPVAIPRHQPSQGMLLTTPPFQHPHSTSGPPGHTQVLPELRLDSDLQQLVLKQDPTVLTHKPRRGGGSQKWRPPTHLCAPVPTPCPPRPELTYSTVHPLLEWEGLCPQDLGWGRRRSEMCRGWRREAQAILSWKADPQNLQAKLPQRSSVMGVGPQQRDLPRTPISTVF